MRGIAIAVALLTTPAWAQTYPATHAASAPAATAFLAQPTVAPGQTVPRPELNRPPAAPTGELVVFRLGSSSQMPGCLAVDKGTQRVVLFQAQPPAPPVPATVIAQADTKAAALAFAQALAPDLLAGS